MFTNVVLRIKGYFLRLPSFLALFRILKNTFFVYYLFSYVKEISFFPIPFPIHFCFSIFSISVSLFSPFLFLYFLHFCAYICIISLYLMLSDGQFLLVLFSLIWRPYSIEYKYYWIFFSIFKLGPECKERNPWFIILGVPARSPRLVH